MVQVRVERIRNHGKNDEEIYREASKDQDKRCDFFGRLRLHLWLFLQIRRSTYTTPKSELFLVGNCAISI